MKFTRQVSFSLLAVMALAGAGLAGCDNGASAVRAPTGGERAEIPASTPYQRDGARPADPSDAPMRLVSGKPYWAANRTRTADENAERSFQNNGKAFDAKSTEDYVAKVHAFVADPPKGSETLKRANGDLLIYDPKGNVFAVVSRDGAPRTMFRPDEGAAYWNEQKSREERRAAAAKRRERDQAEG